MKRLEMINEFVDCIDDHIDAILQEYNVETQFIELKEDFYLMYRLGFISEDVFFKKLDILYEMRKLHEHR